MDRDLPRPASGPFIRWPARAALTATALAAAWAVVDPTFEPAQVEVDPDEVAHALFVYFLTLLGIFSFPRMRPIMAGGIVAALSLVVELAQGGGFVSGSFQLRDLAADSLGILAALLPLAVPQMRPRDSTR
ncbi:MAG TPA: hypothetical protein VGW34_02675 [Allosphingosinicella sp.]|nr:hypothetical protein [Allosphingosinicella sp.]